LAPASASADADADHESAAGRGDERRLSLEEKAVHTTKYEKKMAMTHRLGRDFVGILW
jgi:hypothetical protein